eukprot:304062-Chlamydomonas_euryale.AAC.1
MVAAAAAAAAAPVADAQPAIVHHGRTTVAAPAVAAAADAAAAAAAAATAAPAACAPYPLRRCARAAQCAPTHCARHCVRLRPGAPRAACASRRRALHAAWQTARCRTAPPTALPRGRLATAGLNSCRCRRGCTCQGRGAGTAWTSLQQCGVAAARARAGDAGGPAAQRCARGRWHAGAQHRPPRPHWRRAAWAAETQLLGCQCAAPHAPAFPGAWKALRARQRRCAPVAPRAAQLAPARALTLAQQTAHLIPVQLPRSCALRAARCGWRRRAPRHQPPRASCALPQPRAQQRVPQPRAQQRVPQPHVGPLHCPCATRSCSHVHCCAGGLPAATHQHRRARTLRAPVGPRAQPCPGANHRGAAAPLARRVRRRQDRRVGG